VNTKRTSTKANPSIHSVTTRRTRRRISKLALFRVKVATIVLSIATFGASLVGIAAYNPGVGSNAALPVQAQQITIAESGSSDLLKLAPPARVTAVRPLVRSRGS
jgi:hypothetical protein